MSTKTKKQETAEVVVELELGELERKDQLAVNAKLQTVRKQMRRLESHSSELFGLRSGPQDFLLQNLEKVQDNALGAKADADLLLNEINKLRFLLGGAQPAPKQPKGRRKRAA